MKEMIHDEKCHWDDPAWKNAYRREYRRRLREKGYRKVELYIDPETSKALEVFLRDYGYPTHPGSALAAWLKDEFRG